MRRAVATDSIDPSKARWTDATRRDRSGAGPRGSWPRSRGASASGTYQALLGEPRGGDPDRSGDDRTGLALDPRLGPTPAPMRLACGEGNPRERVAALALAFSPDGTTIATIHTDGRVALRDLSKGRGLRFLGDRGYACALAFSPDGRHLALGGYGPDITLCDLETEGAEDPLKMPIARYHRPGVLVRRPDPRGCVPPDRPDPPLGRGRAPRTGALRGHSSPVLSLAFAPDGRSLASGGGIGDQAIIVWDLATGGQRLRLVTPGFVTALAYSPDGSLLASANGFRWSPPHLGPRCGPPGSLDRQSLHLPESDGLRPGRPAAGHGR